MQPDKPRPKITIKRKPRKLEATATPAPEAIEPAVQVASNEGERIQPDIEAAEPVTPAPEGQAPELTTKQLKKQRRRERQAAEAALLAAAEAEAARVAELQAEAEKAAAAEAEALRIAEALAAEAARIAEVRAARAEKWAAMTPEERTEHLARMEAERVAGEVSRDAALAILNKNPIFSRFLPLEIGSGKKLVVWAFERGKGTISMKAAREVVSAHCRHPRYLKHVLTKFRRYDPISWKPVGEITQEEKDFARLELKKRQHTTEMLPETLPEVEEVEVLPEMLQDVTETQEQADKNNQGDNQG